MDIKEYRGVEKLVYAEVVKDDSTAITFGTVKPLAGVAEISKERENSTEAHYYDNRPIIVINSNGSEAITITTSAIEDEVLADITGQKYDSTKGLLIEKNAKVKYFAIGYITKTTDGKEKYVWRLKGTFGVPASTHTTENNSTDAAGQELTYTGIQTMHKFTNAGDDTNHPEAAFGIVVDAKKTTEETFFGTVQDPDTFTPKK